MGLSQLLAGGGHQSRLLDMLGILVTLGGSYQNYQHVSIENFDCRNLPVVMISS